MKWNFIHTQDHLTDLLLVFRLDNKHGVKKLTRKAFRENC